MNRFVFKGDSGRPGFNGQVSLKDDDNLSLMMLIFNFSLFSSLVVLVNLVRSLCKCWYRLFSLCFSSRCSWSTWSKRYVLR